MADLHTSLVEKNIAPGEATQLTPLVRRINAGNAGLMTGPGTNTYLLGVDAVAVLGTFGVVYIATVVLLKHPDAGHVFRLRAPDGSS